MPKSRMKHKIPRQKNSAYIKTFATVLDSGGVGQPQKKLAIAIYFFDAVNNTEVDLIRKVF